VRSDFVMERKIYIIVVAGGNGSRMGSSVPKQFLELNGIPILQRTIETMVEALPNAKIITVLPQEHLEEWKRICEKSSFFFPQSLVKGGISRFHSVKNALAKVPPGAIVAVHDGVRPLVSVNLVKTLIEKAAECPAVIPVLPVTDSLKFKDGSFPEPDREAMVAVQTPQVFHSEILKEAYSQAYSTCFTDDASVVVRKGIPLAFVEGERTNIKLTTSEDLGIASAFLKEILNR